MNWERILKEGVKVYCSSICMEGPRKTMRSLSQDSQSLNHGLNPGPPGYEASVLSTWQQQLLVSCPVITCSISSAELQGVLLPQNLLEKLNVKICTRWNWLRIVPSCGLILGSLKVGHFLISSVTVCCLEKTLQHGVSSITTETSWINFCRRMCTVC